MSFGEVGDVLQALYRTFCKRYVPSADGVTMDEEKTVAAVSLTEGDGERAETLTLF